MNNFIISNLEKFEKPNKDFIKNKECLICLESIDIEAIKIVKLPCECSNSVYHITCIKRLLDSGQNKNFCPHCKTKYVLNYLYYEITEQNRILAQNMLNSIATNVATNTSTNVATNTSTNVETHTANNRNIIIPNIFNISKFVEIMLLHILINSIMNIINIVVSDNNSENKEDEYLDVLTLFCFFKIFFNFFILLYLQNNIDKIESFLIYSYIYQVVIFGFVIYLLTKLKNNYYTIILLLNNILLFFIDILSRIIIECRENNRVDASL
jgi:hypothetical protein